MGVRDNVSQISEMYTLGECVEGDHWRALWRDERTRLVRLCARLTGDADAAEDLAQEALFEAWRHRDGLRDPEKRAQWLTGVARNVCLRWARQRGRSLAHEAPFSIGTLTTAGERDANDRPQFSVIEPADSFDLEIELERHELVTLLDRALASLPPETRTALIAHYVEASPLAEIAARLGASASAVAMRLQRGKLAMRRVLTTEFGAELAAYGLGIADAGQWEQTRLWCTMCGQRRLMGRYLPDAGELWLWCPSCIPTQPTSEADDEHMQIHTHSRQILGGVRGYKRAVNRLTDWVEAYYHPNLREARAPCLHCGRSMPFQCDLSRPTDIPPALHGESPGVYHWCPVCQAYYWESLHGLLLATPAGRRFMARHPRLRGLPIELVEAEGRAAIISPFVSMTTGERLTMIAAADTFELLRVYGAPDAEDGAACDVTTTSDLSDAEYEAERDHAD